MITVYVQSRQDLALELEVSLADTVASLKTQVADGTGVAVENQRLIINGMNMQDERNLASYELRHAAKILLVPQLKEQAKARPMTFAPRGLLMVPATNGVTSSSKLATGPCGGGPAAELPITFEDVPRGLPFPVSLEFDSRHDRDVFLAGQGDVPPVLVVQAASARAGQQPPVIIETAARFDAGVEALRLQVGGAALGPARHYEAQLLHLPGRPEAMHVTMATGAAVM